MPVAPEQLWALRLRGPSGVFERLLLAVVSTSASGEVVLRPQTPTHADQLFPLHETTFKGKPVTERNCPFLWVTDRLAKGSNGAYRPDDLVVHEAWSVWSDMSLQSSCI
jgi:hypothetical protein